MKQILPKLKEVNKYLNFLKNCFTKPQFNHVKNYVGGLIALNKKTISSISSSSKEEKDQSNLNRFLTESEWNENEVQDRYLKKINHQTKGKAVSLIIDIISLCLRNGLILIGNIKSNRVIQFEDEKNEWIKISKYYKSISRKKNCFYNNYN